MAHSTHKKQFFDLTPKTPANQDVMREIECLRRDVTALGSIIHKMSVKINALEEAAQAKQEAAQATRH